MRLLTPVCLIFSLRTVLSALPEFDRRSLIPKALVAKMCARDGALPICSYPVGALFPPYNMPQDVLPINNPVSIWRLCEHNPHIGLCRLQAAKAEKAANKQPQIIHQVESGSSIFEEAAEPVDNRHALMEKTEEEVEDLAPPTSPQKKLRNPDPNPDPFDDSVIFAEENVFAEMEQLRRSI